jgi:hypothetical protein
VEAQACDPSPGEAEAGGWQVPGQPGLHSKTLSQKKVKIDKRKCEISHKNIQNIQKYLLFS